MRVTLSSTFSARINFTSSAEAVFRQLAGAGPATRPQLCEALNLSRPTMSAAISELSQFEFVEKIGEVQGTTGRKAGMYRIGAGAGHIIGLDAGSSHIGICAGTLDGRKLREREYRLPSSQRRLNDVISRVVAEAVDEIRSATENSWGPLRALGIALPARVSDSASPPHFPRRQNNIFSHFTPPEGVPILLENNVNCAAIAEHNYGAAIGQKDFVYIQVGLKIGMGVVLGGELVRGKNGAAGEVSRLPFPWTHHSEPMPEELEIYLGSEAFMQRVHDEWPEDGSAGDSPADSIALFDLAAQGHPEAKRHVERHAKDIGHLVTACASIIDPGLVVLGGGIGQNLLLAPLVQEAANRLAYPTQVESTKLAADATLLGIMKIASEHSQELLVGRMRPDWPVAPVLVGDNAAT